MACDGAGILVGSLDARAAQLEVEARWLGTDLFMLAVAAAKQGMIAAKATMLTAMDADSKNKLEHLARFTLKRSNGLPKRASSPAASRDNDFECLATIAFDQLFEKLTIVATSGTNHAKQAVAKGLINQLHKMLRGEYQVVAGKELDCDDKQLEAELIHLARYWQQRNGPAAHPLDVERDNFEKQLSVVERAIQMEHPTIKDVIHMAQLGIAQLRQEAKKKAPEAVADEWEEFEWP